MTSGSVSTRQNEVLSFANEMTKDQYKEYFEQNNFKGNNYETAKFIKFLMEKSTKGKEMEELTGMKHSQITSYKKIINSGKIEELRGKSVSKVFKSIEKPKKLNNVLIRGIEKLNLGSSGEEEAESEYDSEEEEKIETWEESMERMSREFENEYTDELEILSIQLEMQNQQLFDENKKLRRKRDPEDRTIEQQQKTIEEQQKTIEEQSETIEEQSGTIEEQSGTLEEQQKTIEEQQKTIEELRRENASLLAYKEIFEKIREKMKKVP